MSTHNQTVKNMLTSSKDMLEACSDHIKTLSANELIHGRNNSYSLNDIAELTHSIALALNTKKANLYLVKMSITSGERENITNVQTVEAKNPQDAFQEAIRAESGCDDANVKGSTYINENSTVLYVLAKVSLLAAEEFAIFKKHCI